MNTTNKNDALLVFMPSGKRGRFPISTAVMDAAKSLGVDINSVCGGRGVCGRCQIEIAEGEFDKHGINSTKNNISAFNNTEKLYRETNGLKMDRRLCCQTKLLGDLVIDVPASSQVHHQVIRKPYETHDILIDPLLHAYVVNVSPPRLEDPRSEYQLLLSSLENDWQLSNLNCDLSIVQNLQSTLKKGNRTITVVVRKDKNIVAIWPGIKQDLFGIAIDVGSTTIAAQLCDLTSGELLASAGQMNPQIRFGEDLMSRISYIMMNDGGEKDLIVSVRKAINDLITEVCKKAKITVNDVMELVVVGNPVMQHLLLGINPRELGVAPFTLTVGSKVEVLASNIDIVINQGGFVYVLPCIAGHVGADAAAVLLAERPFERNELSLIIDVGTNAEIILGNKN
ncbi:MAG: 2Fe-2S iron-sulfur cluster binding domain-containing protein, partial [Gammaproteobacteria bacterium]|nr:2Fe-2S iron-sulfur cluster binding domain-containing protein [Gammaproteobacteria bacterium]